ncbi:hypothetical protein [Virgibacillus halodenitrificans]|uniref:hypothetical protein n=1 Tax=Virgibacillus halodenitrificans TaxID=1482 RepID=UPI0013CEA7A2
MNSSYGLTKRGCEWSYKTVQYILNNTCGTFCRKEEHFDRRDRTKSKETSL